MGMYLRLVPQPCTVVIAFFTLFFSSYNLFAAEADLDPNFTAGPFVRNGATIDAILELSNGQFLVSGTFSNFDVPRANVVRLNADGSVDPSFKVAAEGFGVVALGEQSSGKIILGGQFSIPGEFIDSLIRLNADGSIDSSFNSPGFKAGSGSGSPFSLLVLSNDKIVIGGSFGGVDDVTRMRLALLDADGNLDESFADPEVDDLVTVIKQAANDKIWIGGKFSNVNGVSRTGIARMKLDGTLDTDFAPDPSPDEVNDIFIQSDGQILVAGRFTVLRVEPDFYYSRGVMRISPAGVIDTSLEFSDISEFQSLFQLTGGKLIVAGNVTFLDGTFASILRLNTDGSIDSTFSSPFTGDVEVRTIHPLPNGEMLASVSETFDTVGKSVFLKLNSSGGIANDFQQTNPLRIGIQKRIALQSDGKILVGGEFDRVADTQIGNVVRLLENGTVDPSFAPDVPNTTVLALGQQSDGKIIMGGGFTVVGEANQPRLARLKTDGAYDDSFTPEVDGSIHDLHVFANGDILIAGGFDLVNGASRKNLALLDSNGATKLEFNALVGGFVTDIEVVNSKIYIAGSFNAVAGETRIRVARLNLNGSLDTSFIGFNPPFFVNGVAAQSSGQSVVVGLNTNVGIFEPGATRLNNDGTEDPGFSPPSFDDRVKDALILADGKIILYGGFTEVNGIPQGFVTRLNSNGILDDTFGNFGADGSVEDAVLQRDGKVIFIGGFQSIRGESHIGLARVLGSPVEDVCFPVAAANRKMAIICL